MNHSFIAVAGAALLASTPAVEVEKFPQLRALEAVTGRRRVGKHNGRTKGTFGGGKKAKAKKAAFLAQSSEDAKKLANEKSIKRLYADWRANMTPEERAAARALKCLQPLADDGAPKARRGQTVDVEFHDPADLPEASDRRTAVDALEPQRPFSVAIENLDCQEITDAADIRAMAQRGEHTRDKCIAAH